jgi:hypothetical protein
MEYKNFFIFEGWDVGDGGEGWKNDNADNEPPKTHMPHGHGYPNYRPLADDNDDFEETVNLDHIAGVPYQHSAEDNKKRWVALYNFIKTKKPEFYSKYKITIDNTFAQHDALEDASQWFIDVSLKHARENPTDVKRYLKDPVDANDITDEDIKIADSLVDLYYGPLQSLIHHRDDPKNYLNYPLAVSLYDVTRRAQGPEDDYFTYYTLIDSIIVKSPDDVLPAATKLYSQIRNFDGRPEIYVEKKTGIKLKQNDRTRDDI